MDITHAVMVQHYTQADAARIHRVSPITVRNLVKKARGNKNFIQELWHKEDEQEDKEAAIQRKTEHFMMVERPIFTASLVRKDLEQDGVSGITDKMVCTVFK